MTFNKTTLPSADTEPAPQYCGDDPFGLDQIPDFLRRTPAVEQPVVNHYRCPDCGLKDIESSQSVAAPDPREGN